MTTVKNTEQKIDAFIEKLEESTGFLDQLAEIQAQFSKLVEQREIIDAEWNKLSDEVQSEINEFRQFRDQSPDKLVDLQTSLRFEMDELCKRLNSLEQVVSDAFSKLPDELDTIRKSSIDNFSNSLACTQDEVNQLSNLVNHIRIYMDSNKDDIDKIKLNNQEVEKVLQQKYEHGIALVMDDLYKKIEGISSQSEAREKLEAEQLTRIETKMENIELRVAEQDKRMIQVGSKPKELYDHLSNQITNQRNLLIFLVFTTTLLSCLSVINIALWLMNR
jgi:hypothetical protein